MRAPDPRFPPAVAVDVPCPRCGIGLEDRSAGRAKLSACRQCGGVWLPKGAARILVDHVLGSLPIVIAAEKAARAARGHAPGDRAAKCPWDAEPLRSVEIDGVEIDVCAVHGAWFDAGEVRLIANAHAETSPSRASGPRTPSEPADVFGILDALEDAFDALDGRSS
jgi:Zn-finger nucleic acid-binding protein